jgi:hypothetical protein
MAGFQIRPFLLLSNYKFVIMFSLEETGMRCIKNAFRCCLG